ncbi:MAG: M48 family metallopeptidase [Steroidobacteraceae bacterium]|jgi:predicted Zn-dependent protease
MKYLNIGVACAAVLLAACETVSTTAPGAVGIERKQVMWVSEADVEQGAAKSYADELGKARGKGQLNTDAALAGRVRTIADRLIKQTPVFRADAAGWAWDVNVQTTPELNAYCMPGGKIMVYSGLVDKLKLSDAELATVVGHEMAHALREHSREAVSRAYAEQLGLGALGALTGIGDSGVQLAGMITQVTFGLPRSRVQEAEADRIGLELMARAGYDPHAALTLWQKMAQAGGGSTPAFLSTHPSSSTRQADLTALLPRVLPLYAAASKP